MTESKALGPRLFTVEEAQSLIPFIRGRLGRFRELADTFDVVQQDLSVLRMVSSSGGSDDNPDLLELTRKEQLESSLVAEMRGVQDDLLEVGCVPKSLREGLIDFFALKGDRLVFLCWREGEDDISTWHTLDGGFSGRRPLESLTQDDI